MRFEAGEFGLGETLDRNAGFAVLNFRILVVFFDRDNFVCRRQIRVVIK